MSQETIDCPNEHGQWEVRQDRRDMGAPPPPFPLCTYCGSMSPDDFLASIRAGHKIGGSDWKYGWPHKFYVDVLNPNPEEIRVISQTWEDGKKKTDIKGTYPVLHLKFYSEHLKDWKPLLDPAVRAEIERATGIYFIQEGNDLKYRAPCHGYQR